MKSQNQRVLDHLIDHGYITQVVAQNYGIRRLAARVLELKGFYVDIRTELRNDDNGSRYAYYSLQEEARITERANRTLGRDWRLAQKAA